MTSEQIKANREMRVFLEFIRKSEIEIDGAPEGRPPPEPDILCKHRGRGFCAFELVELCDQEIAHTTAKLIDSGGGMAFMCNEDPSAKLVRSKIEKKYQTNHPIELLCYTGGRLVTPDDVIIPTIREIIEAHGFGQFRRIRLLGEEVCEVVSERPI